LKRVMKKRPVRATVPFQFLQPQTVGGLDDFKRKNPFRSVGPLEWSSSETGRMVNKEKKPEGGWDREEKV